MAKSLTRITAISLFLLLAAIILGGCAPKTTTTSQAPAPLPPEESTAASTPKEDGLYESKVKVEPGTVLVMKTDVGTMKFDLYEKDAPNTVASFVELAQQDFFNGVKFHRVIQGFMAQGGDPQTKDVSAADLRRAVGADQGGDAPAGTQGVYGTGGPGFRLKAEFNSRKHIRGTLAMARSQDPDSAGSQFYIAFEPAPFLDGQYTVFGQLKEGDDVLSKVKVGTTIESVSIEKP